MNGPIENITLRIEFHILGFSSSVKLQQLLFIGILVMYLLTVLGNMLIVTLVCLVSQLQTPMYFFLCNLAIQDIVCVSAIMPKLLAITITHDTRIYYLACVIQMFLFLFCVNTEFFILTAMSYDRYVAICIPLHYALIMNKKVCVLLALVSWIISIFNALMFALILSNLSFCNSKDINHIFCDLKTLLEMSCSDLTNVKCLIFSEGALFGILPLTLIMVSYANIISTILKIRSSVGRAKTFSSCSSHLIIVIIFYGTAISIYLKPESDHSQEQDKLLSMLYIAVVPMLNPLVYSLRNKQVLQALNKLIGKKANQRTIVMAFKIIL